MARPTDLVPVPSGINAGVSSSGNTVMLALLGNPRSSYDTTCQPPTNAALRARIAYGRSVGPFKVSGFDLAVESLREVFADVKVEKPEIYAVAGTAGMLCCRLVRGSRAAISNHSWGTAVDLTIDGVLDRRGNDRVQIGLAEIAPVFNRHGWYWGAGFPTEDGMHFEISDQKLRRWQAEGKLFEDRVTPPSDVLRFGDRSAEVQRLQRRLNELGEKLEVDGVFGPATHAAVIAFQSRHGLEPDGIVGRKTWRALLA